MKHKSCAFTGYRPSRFSFRYDENSPICKAIKESLHRIIATLVEAHGVRYFYTGGAMGADMWAAEAVCAYRAKNEAPTVYHTCALPFWGHDAAWNKREHARLRAILGVSDVHIQQAHYEPQAYLERNRYLVNHADYLVAVFDPYTKRGRTGTGQTVRLAVEKGLTILYVHPETGAITHDGTLKI